MSVKVVTSIHSLTNLRHLKVESFDDLLLHSIVKDRRCRLSTLTIRRERDVLKLQDIFQVSLMSSSHVCMSQGCLWELEKPVQVYLEDTKDVTFLEFARLRNSLRHIVDIYIDHVYITRLDDLEDDYLPYTMFILHSVSAFIDSSDISRRGDPLPMSFINLKSFTLHMWNIPSNKWASIVHAFLFESYDTLKCRVSIYAESDPRRLIHTAVQSIRSHPQLKYIRVSLGIKCDGVGVSKPIDWKLKVIPGTLSLDVRQLSPLPAVTFTVSSPE